MEEPNQKLKYRLIEASSEDPEYPLYELLRGVDSSGWVSVRFCTYPQEILLQFLTPVHLRQINILSNEKKIPSLIEFYCFYPSNSNEMYSNYKSLSFDKLGYIRMDTNSKTNYKAREFRKVFVDTNCLYLKLVLQKNYLNKYNVFNQVGLISLEFFGTPILTPKNELYLKESLRNRQEVNEEEMDEISQEKLKILKNQLEEALKIEDFDDAKKIKQGIDRIKLIGKKIYELEVQKKVYINNDDFDNAKIMKLEIERLKSNLKFLDKVDKSLPDIVPYQNMSLEINKSQDMDENREKELNDETREKEAKEMSFSITHDTHIADRSVLNKSANIKILEKIEEEEFIPHDDQIIPAIRKKLNMTNPNVSQSLDEYINEDKLKGELEELDPRIRQMYEPFIKYIGEEGLKKLFSKNILWKDEGLDFFNKTLPTMFNEGGKTGNETNTIINLVMKMIFTFLSEKHPQVCIRSIDIFETLLDQIKKSNANLNYDFNVTDNILTKIKEKLGDVNPKLRNKAVELYCHMLKQDSCDYNNLISELVEEELKHIDSKKVTKSSKMIIGKLSIFDTVFDDFPNAIKEKRTDTTSFPSILVSTYVIENIPHSKSEVRRLARSALIKMYKIFGFKKLEPLLKKVDSRELEKLISELPEVEEIIKQNQNAMSLNNSINGIAGGNRNKSANPRGRSTSRDRSKERTNTNKSQKHVKSKSPSNIICTYCGKSDKKFVSEKDITDHIAKECVMFSNCIKCKENIEVKVYNNHLLNDCKMKNEFKHCKRCKEAIYNKEYDSHVKENKCNPAKNPNSSNRCPLCHKDIPPQDKGFVQHLVKDICQKQKRREKVAFINGK